jgi:hypothetical protein
VLRIFIGYDPLEAVAFHTLSHSILRRASIPVSIAPVMQSQLRNLYSRPRGPTESTEFSLTRFLVPALSEFRGWSVFMDCDMLMLDDIASLYRLRDDRYSVMVVKHDHVPTETVKFLGEPQSKYEKKNWSSVILFNNARCRALTPEYVNAASGLELHQFKWLGDDGLIGDLPDRWNHLVGYSAPRRDAALVHYTQGGPYFGKYRDCEYSKEWFAERDQMLRTAERAKA